MGMIQVDEDALKAYQAEMQAYKNAQAAGQTQMAQYQVEHDNQNVGMVKEQLDLSHEIRRIDALLRGCSLIIDNKSGREEWIEPTDDRMKIFSDYGIQEIRNLIAWYINKNQLLSNYPEIEMIDKKMRRFAHAFNHLIYMKYEDILEQPSVDACISELKDRLSKKAQIKAFAYDLMGKFYNDESIQKEVLNEMEGRIEKELENIRKQLMKNKLKKFDLIQREIEDTVHATMLRALRGEERGSFRRHMNITEARGGLTGAPIQQPTGIKALFGMGGKK